MDGTHIYTYQNLVPHSSSEIWKEKSIKSIAYQRDLYTVQNNGENDDTFEKWLAYEIESPVNEILVKIKDEKKLDKEDFEYLIKFLASHDLRTPSEYIQFQKFWNENAKLGFERALKKFELLLNSDQPIAPIKNEKNFFSDKFKFTITHGEGGSLENSSMESEIPIGRKLWLQRQQYHMKNSLNVLLRYKWSVGRLARKIPMFISDNPVVKMKLNNNGTFHLGSGWGNSNLIFLPLSPRHIFFTVDGENYPDYIVFSTKESKHLQKLICYSMYRYIFAHEMNPIIPKLIPRSVDTLLYQKDLEYWRNFHKIQIEVDQ